MNQHQPISPGVQLDACIRFLQDLERANHANSLAFTLIIDLKQWAFGQAADKAESHVSQVDQLFKKHLQFIQHAGLEVSYAEVVGVPTRITINDHHQFSEFFNKLPDILFTDAHKVSLEPLMSHLLVQFDELCSADSLSSEDAEMLKSFSAIGNTCGLLGYHKETQVFSRGLELHKLGIYREAKIVTDIRSSLDGQFNPSQWHTDSTAEDYKRRWDSLLEKLNVISNTYVLSDQFADIKVKIVTQAEEAKMAVTRELSCIDREQKLRTLAEALEVLERLNPSE